MGCLHRAWIADCCEADSAAGSCGDYADANACSYAHTYS